MWPNRFLDAYTSRYISRLVSLSSRLLDAGCSDETGTAVSILNDMVTGDAYQEVTASDMFLAVFQSFPSTESPSMAYCGRRLGRPQWVVGDKSDSSRYEKLAVT